jgi:hypothetical protein
VNKQTENHGVGGSIPPLGTNNFSHLHQKSESELDTFVRALVTSGSSALIIPCILADVSAVSEALDFLSPPRDFGGPLDGCLKQGLAGIGLFET